MNRLIPRRQSCASLLPGTGGPSLSPSSGSSRELIYFFVWREIKVRYKQTAIGAAWAVLQPFMSMLVFTLFFGRLAHIPSEGSPYPIFYYSALLPWMYFANSVQNATGTIVQNQSMITKVYFPRLALPLSAVLSGLVDFGIGFLMFLAMMIYYGIQPGIPFLFFPLFLLLAVLTAIGLGLWLGAMNALYRDVRYVVPFLVQFWLFASPVAYPASLVPAKWRWLYGLNPMAGVIEGFRWSLSGHGAAPRPSHPRFRTDCCGRARFRAILFSEDGGHHCRRSLTRPPGWTTSHCLAHD